ncbi:LacI family DNA-binding transcriptional regulator [Sphingomonas mali]|uniref:LacI family DNA-binding transcriptional regulator n=1 Tax=Sphingomonas mali TaxID=40682 RepID=UPI001FE145BB
MTVSRVINGASHVRPRARDAVNAAIAALNYAPNRAARNLAGGGQVRVGLLYSNPSAAYLSEFLVGTLDQASRSDIQLIVEKCDPGGEEAAARHLMAGGIDGILLPPPLCDSKPLLALLAAEKVTAVVVASGLPAEGVSAVSIDDFDAARAMTRQIAGLGHKRIGFIIGNPDQTASARRLDGYRAALVEEGIAVDEALIVQGLFSYRSGLEAAEKLLDLPVPPSAIFASNDDMAAAAVAVAHRRGLDVPGKLTVCGFDDTTLATAIWPELTTVHQPIADMSRAAVEILVSEIAARREGERRQSRRIVLDFTLVRRQSDGPPG